MNTFALDKNYEKFDFNELSVDDLKIVSGGSGGYNSFSDAEKAGGGLAALALGFGIVALATNPVGWIVGGAGLLLSAGGGYALGDGLSG